LQSVGGRLTGACEVGGWKVGAIAAPQLLYPEATAAEWLFSQEEAILLDAGEGK
jgi:hypothetical protein